MAGENKNKGADKNVEKASVKKTKSSSSASKKTTEIIDNPYKKNKAGSGDGKKPVSKNKNVAKNADKSSDVCRSKNGNAKTEQPAKSKKKAGSVILSVFTVFFAVLAGIVVIYFLISLCDPIVYSDFYSSAEKVVKIPGTNEGFVPQGLAYSDDKDVYLLTGYMQDKSPSRIYVVSADGQSKEIRLLKENGEAFTGHAGGISCSGNNVYVSNDEKVFYLRLSTLLGAEDLEQVRFEGSFVVPCSASFTFCNDEMLYVGEFYHTGYDTDDSHIIDLPNGEKNQALVFGYPLDENGKFGVEDINSPKLAYSVRDKVQGFAVTPDGRIALSCSFSVADSHMYFYNHPKAESYELDGVEIPLYVLDDGCLTKTVTMPFMSEDLDIVGNGIVISFESYAPKYGGGMLPFSINNVMKYKLD